MRPLALALSLLAVCIGACASTPGSAVEARRPEGTITPTERRLYATPGSLALLQVGPADALPETVPVTIGTSEIEGHTWRVVVGADADARPWLPPAGRWSVHGVAEKIPAGSIATTYVAIPMPVGTDADYAQVGAIRIPIAWIGTERPADDPSPAPPATLERLLVPELASPVRRWRYKLVTRTLLAGDSAVPAFDDPIIEALALQTEARWRHALLRLGREDPRVAARLVARIGRLITFGGRIVPAWPTSLADLEALLGALLDPSQPGAALLAAAESYLAGQRIGAAWVSDDAGAQTVTDRAPITAITCLNLDERPLVASCAVPGAGAPSDLKTLAPASSQIFRVARPKASSEASEIEAQVGGWRATLPVLPAPIQARPPGVVVGPFQRDWTLESLYTGRSDVAAAPALVRVNRPSESSEWALFSECERLRAGQGTVREEFIRIWFGPTSRSRAVLTVTEKGEVHVESMREGVLGTARAEVASDAGRWAAILSIPSGFLENDGSLLIAVERYDANGERTAVPRAMLPWQAEPGRVAIDLTAW